MLMMMSLFVILPEGALRAEADSMQVSTEEYLLSALYDHNFDGGSITLTRDITVNQNIETAVDITINLDGHTLTFAKDKYLDINLPESSKIFTIKGNGNIVGSLAGAPIYLTKGKLNFESGSVTNNATHSTATALNADEPGNITVTQGEFISTAAFNSSIKLAEGSSKVTSADGKTTTVIPSTKYDLFISETQVTNLNCTDILGDGVFSYDHSTKTLKINGQYNGNTGSALIHSQIAGLNIEAVKDSTVNGFMQLYGDTTFTGEGKLTVKCSKDHTAIYSYNNSTVKVKDAKMHIIGKHAFEGNRSNEKLVFDNCHVTSEISATFINMEYRFDEITLIGCVVTEPDNAVVKYGEIYNEDGAELAKNVTIDTVTQYGLHVAGVHVDDRNCGDILGDGVFSYDNETKTLTVNGDHSGELTECAIENEIDGLTVNTVKDSNLSGYLDLRADTTLTGKGKLTLTTDKYYASIRFGRYHVITIKDTKIETNGGFILTGRGYEELIIDNSDLTGNTTRGYCYSSDYIKTLTLKKSIIIEPEGAVIKGGTVYESDGTTIAKNVTIKAYDLKEVPAKEPTCSDEGNIKYYTEKYTGKLFADADAETEIKLEDTVVEAKGHRWEMNFKDNNCTEDGFAEEKCTVCGEIRNRMDIPAHGHNWVTESREATCTEDGYTEEKCTVCGETRNHTDEPAPGHAWGEWEIIKEATKEESGEKKHTCERCGYTETVTFGLDPDDDWLLGDVDANGKVNAVDITKTAAHIKGLKTLNEDQKKRADVNYDGKINAGDITKIAAHIKGLKKLVKK